MSPVPGAMNPSVATKPIALLASRWFATARQPTRWFALLPAAWALLVLTGCGSLLHSDAHPDQIYLLRAQVPERNDPVHSVGASLRVAHPLAAPGLDSSQIVLVQPDRRMNYYAASRWPAAVPEVVESLVVETLRSSGEWKSVEDSTSPFPSDYLLQISVRRFDADYSSAGPGASSASGTAAPNVRVALDCIIGRREGRDVIATFTAEGSSRAAANRLGDVVAAFESATNSALASLSDQTAKAVSGAQDHNRTVNR